jgi:hypothetical protein
MPSQYREKLIRLYASNPVVQIETVPEYTQLRGRLAEDRHFQEERYRIERAKAKIEAAINGTMTQRESVQNAIKLLLQCRGNDQLRDLYHDLIVAGYKPNWTLAQQQHFDEAWKVIKLKYDYFLSFTCRHTVDLGDNPVNTAYKHFISRKLGSMNTIKLTARK